MFTGMADGMVDIALQSGRLARTRTLTCASMYAGALTASFWALRRRRIPVKMTWVAERSKTRRMILARTAMPERMHRGARRRGVGSRESYRGRDVSNCLIV